MIEQKSPSPLRRVRNRLPRLFLTAGIAISSAASGWALQGGPNQFHHGGGGGGCGGGPTSAPEIQPSLLIGALVLVVGCVLILTAGRSRKSAEHQP